MPRCVYCLRSGPEATFTRREHVMPAGLGSFSPFNATIRDNVVCDACNELFSPLETNFVEDSFEGVMGQRLNLQNRNSVTIRGRCFRVQQDAGFGEGFFNNTFFFLKPENNDIVIDLRNQVQLRGFQDGHLRVFKLESLEGIADGTSKFEKLRRELGNLNPRGISILAADQAAQRRIVAQLQRFGITYTERESLYHRFEDGERVRVEHSMEGTINGEIGRILAKIAFNYFAYCAMEENQIELLYGNEFDAVRKFVHGGTGILRSIIVSINEEPILFDEAQRDRRLIAHIITFREEAGQVVVRMSFFGAPNVYKIILGSMPTFLQRDDFGCGHLFNPFSHSVHSLTQTPPENPMGEQVHRTFGLFRRTPTL